MTHNRNWMKFKNAKKFLKSKNIKSKSHYDIFIKENKISNLPTNPAIIYSKEWLSMGDFLGTDYVAPQKRKFKTYENAKLYVQSLNLKSKKVLQQKVKQGELDPEIPLNPQVLYKNNGWMNWGDFFGLRYHNDRNYLSYQDAKIVLKKLNFKTQNEFKDFIKNHEKKFYGLNIPINPNKYYSKNIWKGWVDFLGNDFEYFSYEKSKKIVQSFKLPNTRAWRDFCKNKKIKEIPFQPNKTYRNKGWKDWGEFLGTGRTYNKEFKSFDDAKKIIKKFKIPGRVFYVRFLREKKIKGLPYKPHKTYKNKWKDWSDYLGVKVRKRNDYSKILDYKKAKHYLQNKNFNLKDWMKFIQEDNFPDFLPRYPKAAYLKEWKGWPDFLGYKPGSRKS